MNFNMDKAVALLRTPGLSGPHLHGAPRRDVLDRRMDGPPGMGGNGSIIAIQKDFRYARRRICPVSIVV